MNTYRLSHYCVLHMQPDNRTFTLVHGLHGSQFELSSLLLPWLVALVNGAPLEEALASAPPEARATFDTLIAEDVLLSSADVTAVETDPFRNQLGPLQLAVQRGFNEGGYYAAEVDHAHPPPVFKTVDARAHLDLEPRDARKNTLATLECLYTRRSIRSYASTALPRSALEQFLNVTARAHALIQTVDLGWISSRNYPSGGARYPLEIYPMIYHVEDIEPGVYHYEPFAHRLARLEMTAEHRELLLTAALQKIGIAEESHGRPAVLLIITAVYARTCWKYRGIPYQLLLMETGALYQTMSLAATALGLAPCPVGAFPELAVAELLGFDPRDEGQIGLFALGVPDRDQLDAAPYAIIAARLIEHSPFSATAASRAVELSFSDGSREVIEIAQICLQTDQGGATRCAIHRGRYWAALEAEVETNLRKILQDAALQPV